MREFIVEADGGSRGNPGPAGYGCVVIDAATGETLAEAAEYLGVVTNNVAEYSGLVAGLKAARELDPTASIRVRMDSKLVVEQMSGRWKIKHPDMRLLATEAARVFPPFQVTYEWIPRAENKHADRLANEAMDAGKRGEQWSLSASTTTSTTTTSTTTSTAAASTAAELDAHAVRAARAARTSVPGPAGPPGDATTGAARARAALAGARGDSVASGAAAVSGASGTSGASSALGTPDAPAVPDVHDGPVSSGESDFLLVPGDGAGKPGADVRAARNVAGASGRPSGAPSVGWGAADMGAPATFVLLRHGETPLTPQKRFSGSGGADPALSAVGREQAERAATAMAARGAVQAIVASPLARCRQTAQAVADRLGLDVVVEDGLREADFGVWEGLTFGEVRERHPEDLNTWLASADAEPTGGGESFTAVARRIAVTRDKLIAAYAGRTVLLVTHVTPIKTFVRLALGAPPESLFRMELSAASISEVAYYGDGNASLRLLNDTSHLR